MSNENNKQIGDYLLNEEIGSGGFAKVVLGTHIPTGEKVAIKIMDKQQILSDELNRERVLSEIAILKVVRHNNIIKLYEVMETPQKIYLVMEYCDGGELFDYIVSKQHLSEKQACSFFQEIIDALTYLHSQNIVHRDVKPENILLESFGKSLTCKLIDFGISRTYTLDKLITTPCGTASYAPPEMHRGEEYYGLLSDVWSAGVLLYAMVFGYLPFCEEDEDTNIDNIIKGNYEIPDEASPELSDLLTHILDINPLTRYDLEQIKKHAWYNLVKPVKSLPGIIIGYHKIPIDDRILDVCEAYGFNKDEVKKSVEDNKYDNKSSIYYIILSKMKREGYDSCADLFSEDYLEYIKNPENLVQKGENVKKTEEEPKKDVKEEEKKELTVLDNIIKPTNETDDRLANPELSQISTENKLKPNKSEAEISVASESSNQKKQENNDSYNSTPKRNKENNSFNSTPKRNDNNNSFSSTPKRKDSDKISIGNRSGSRSRSDSSYKSSKLYEGEKFDVNDINIPSKEENLVKEEKEVKEEENKPLETLTQIITNNEEPNVNVNSNVNNEEEINNNKNNEEIVNEKPEIVTPQSNIEEVNQPEINNEQQPISNNEEKGITPQEPKEAENVEQQVLQQPINETNETNKEVEQKINPTVEEIINANVNDNKEEDIINKPESEVVVPSTPTEEQTQIQTEKENIPISIQVQNESEENKEPLITLSEKINPEKEEIINASINNVEIPIVKQPEIEQKVEEKPIEKEPIEEKPEQTVVVAEEPKIEEKNPEPKEKEIEIEEKPAEEQIEKKDKKKEKNKLKPENPVSNVSNIERPRDKLLSRSIIPKHSFFINSKTKNKLSFNIDDDDNNNDKLNSSFTMKLTDSLKENVLKMRNPKMKNPNKEKEINKALQEIKQKKGAPTKKAKKDNIPKPKNKKNVKIPNEPLFRENKRKEHTIIHNRNASAINTENRRNNRDDNNDKSNKRKKESSMAKIVKKNINNVNNVDLKNNIKNIKKGKDTGNTKDKDNTKDKEGSKKRNLHIIKKINKDDKANNKKSSVDIKKNNIPRPRPIKKNESSASTCALNITSNTKPSSKNNSSLQNNTILKTPRKNMEKSSLEPIYKKINKTNATITINKSEKNINKTIQLTDVKKINKRSKIPYDKKSNMKNKKNIRLAFKNIEEENDISKDDINKTTDINFNKIKLNNVKVDLTIDNTNNGNKTSRKTKVIHHRKNYSMKDGNKSMNKYIYTQNNDNLMSHRNLNSKGSVTKIRNEPQNNKNTRYQLINTERNADKTKRFFNMPTYEGNKTEASAGGKSGNSKLVNNKKPKYGKNIKNNTYYGPIDINNIVVGDSAIEINDTLIDILHKNRVKYWNLNPFKLYCNKNGEIFVIEIFILSNKIIDNNDNKEKENNKDENEIREFDLNKNENGDEKEIKENKENEDNKDDNNNLNNNDKQSKIMFYITILSKDSNNKSEAKVINRIINKKFREKYKK